MAAERRERLLTQEESSHFPPQLSLCSKTSKSTDCAEEDEEEEEEEEGEEEGLVAAAHCLSFRLPLILPLFSIPLIILSFPPISSPLY